MPRQPPGSQQEAGSRQAAAASIHPARSTRTTTRARTCVPKPNPIAQHKAILEGRLLHRLLRGLMGTPAPTRVGSKGFVQLSDRPSREERDWQPQVAKVRVRTGKVSAHSRSSSGWPVRFFGRSEVAGV
jgi:hypothetical protein